MTFKFNQQQIQEAISADIPSYMNNLRDRDPILRKDCFIRGKLAEIWFRDFFQCYGFQVETNLKDGGTDIDLSIKALFLNSQKISFDAPIKIEIKTSLIPNKNFDIYKSGDLKIYAKNDNPSYDIDWNMGIQVYYHQLKREWEQNIPNFNSDLASEYEKLNFSCSWIEKNRALSYIQQLSPNDRKWSFLKSRQEFWHCPLGIHSHNIYESVVYLMSILLNKCLCEVNLLQNEIQRLQNY